MTIAGDYQGFPIRGLSLRRSLGFVHDVSTVDIVVSDFPNAPRLNVPGVGGLGVVGGGAVGQTDPTRSLENLPRFLNHVGTVSMFEVETNPDGTPVREHRESVPGLFVSTRRKAGAGMADGTLSIFLVDERKFWDRGHCDRWRFGIEGPNGIVPDSLNPDGTLPTAADVVRYAATRLPFAPRVARIPTSWETLLVSVEIEPFGSPRRLLEKLFERHPARIALHWDRSIGIYLQGEGQIGQWTGSGTGANTGRLPDDHHERAGGLGDQIGDALELPPDFVIVAGGERIFTVAIDGWDSVLEIDGELVPIAEGLALLLRGEEIRRLRTAVREAERDLLEAVEAEGDADDLARTTARERVEEARDELEAATEAADPTTFVATPAELSWLRRFVLRPDDDQIAQGLNDDELEILRRDADRLFRLPFAESSNAHLLPLLPQAETDAKGRRFPVEIETYRWRFRRTTPLSDRALGGALVSAEEGALRQADHDLARVQQGIATFIRSGRATSADFGGGPAERARGNLATALAELRNEVAPGQDEALDNLAEEVSAFAPIVAASLARRGLQAEIVALTLENVSGGEALAQSYRQVLQRRDEAAVPVSVVFYDMDLARELSRRLIEIGQLIREAGGTPPPGVTVPLITIVSAWLERRREFQLAVADQRSTGIQTFRQILHAVNLPRSLDAGAVLEDENRGTIRTSQPAGLLDEEDVPDVNGRELIPRPVRVRFGVLARPRLPDTRPVTGLDPELASEIPDDLLEVVEGSDQRLGFFNVAFVRGGDNVVRQVPLSEVPNGASKTIQRQDLVELIPLDQPRNTSRLTAEARRAATSLVLSQPPVQVEETRFYLRPRLSNPNGVLSGNEIVLRPGGRGFRSIVHIGRQELVFSGVGGTRTRDPDRRGIQLTPAEGVSASV